MTIPDDTTGLVTADIDDTVDWIFKGLEVKNEEGEQEFPNLEPLVEEENLPDYEEAPV